MAKLVKTKMQQDNFNNRIAVVMIDSTTCRLVMMMLQYQLEEPTVVATEKEVLNLKIHFPSTVITTWASRITHHRQLPPIIVIIFIMSKQLQRYHSRRRRRVGN